MLLPQRHSAKQCQVNLLQQVPSQPARTGGSGRPGLRRSATGRSLAGCWRRRRAGLHGFESFKRSSLWAQQKAQKAVDERWPGWGAGVGRAARGTRQAQCARLHSAATQSTATANQMEGAEQRRTCGAEQRYAQQRVSHRSRVCGDDLGRLRQRRQRHGRRKVACSTAQQAAACASFNACFRHFVQHCRKGRR